MIVSRSRIIAVCFFVWIFSTIVYLPSVDSDFVNFDDHEVLLSFPERYSEESLPASLKAIVIDDFPREEPLILRDITWAINSYLFGFENAAAYHVGNILLNSCNVVLLFVFLLMLTNRFAFSLIVTLTFTVVPVHAEPVCWVMGRKDVLVTFFLLLTLISQLRYVDSRDQQKRRVYYLLMILTMTAALLSKINALSFFLVIGALFLFREYLNGVKNPDASIEVMPALRTVLLRTLPFAVISIGVFFWYKGIISEWGIIKSETQNLTVEHLTDLFTLIPLVLFLYLKLIFVPVQHSVFYDWPSIHQPLTAVQVALSFVSVGGIVFLLGLFYCRRKDLFFFLFAFLAIMIPYLNIIYIGIWVANRYVYFASVFILAIAADSMMGIVSNRRALVRTAVTILWLAYLGVNCYHCLRYQEAWKNDRVLWEYETGLNNPSLLSFAALATAYIGLGDEQDDPRVKAEFYKEAEESLQSGRARFDNSTICETTPHLYKYYYLQGVLAERNGSNLKKQLEFFEKAYQLKSRNRQVVRKMAELYFKLAKQARKSTEKRALAHRSLNYFIEYCDLIPSGVKETKENMVFLEEVYLEEFPILKNIIAGVLHQEHGIDPR